MNLIEKDEKYVWHPFSQSQFAFSKAVLNKAQGAYVYDETGKKYLDTTSSWWCHLHGHCDPRLTKALSEQAQTMDQVLFAPHTHAPGVELAEKLVEKAGPAFGKVFYSDNGSTAVETGLKIAIQYWQNIGRPQKKRLLCLQGGYHGDTLGAVSVGGIGDYHHGFSSVVHPAVALPEPYFYRKAYADESEEVFWERLLKNCKEIFEHHANESAALILEPLIQGANGMTMYSAAYLERLVQLAKSYEILVIFDEVFTGFGRTGKFFAKDHIESEPDILCVSKGLTSGVYPLGATIVRGPVFETFLSPENTFYHGHTHTGDPLGCRVALESLKIFEDDNVLEKNKALSKVMASQRGKFFDLPNVGEVRHLGMVWAAELVKCKQSKGFFEPRNGPGWQIAEQMWQKGYWVRPLHNMLYTVPPYCVTQDELEGFFKTLHETIHAHFKEI